MHQSSHHGFINPHFIFIFSSSNQFILIKNLAMNHPSTTLTSIIEFKGPRGNSSLTHSSSSRFSESLPHHLVISSAIIHQSSIHSSKILSTHHGITLTLPAIIIFLPDFIIIKNFPVNHSPIIHHPSIILAIEHHPSINPSIILSPTM
ncbi:hypothetical protein PGT21_015170 [Puccinia graminis f. sp. tritici]|uniref:Uncharacterized protein n=1 Tax=Puccinia graminis f. sp. tritici TaxID=56615 RepID=A0A5B0MUR2_PUCGR|nr:hypothetical protein PGT21_015170 [Puccinia graminis f. sp. tritici]